MGEARSTGKAALERRPSHRRAARRARSDAGSSLREARRHDALGAERRGRRRELHVDDARAVRKRSQDAGGGVLLGADPTEGTTRAASIIALILLPTRLRERARATLPSAVRVVDAGPDRLVNAEDDVEHLSLVGRVPYRVFDLNVRMDGLRCDDEA